MCCRITTNKMLFGFLVIDVLNLVQSFSNIMASNSCNPFMKNWIRTDNILNFVHNLMIFIQSGVDDHKDVLIAEHVAGKLVEEARKYKLEHNNNVNSSLMKSTFGKQKSLNLARKSIT